MELVSVKPFKTRKRRGVWERGNIIVKALRGGGGSNFGINAYLMKLHEAENRIAVPIFDFVSYSMRASSVQCSAFKVSVQGKSWFLNSEH